MASIPTHPNNWTYTTDNTGGPFQIDLIGGTGTYIIPSTTVPNSGLGYITPSIGYPYPVTQSSFTFPPPHPYIAKVINDQPCICDNKITDREWELIRTVQSLLYMEWGDVRTEAMMYYMAFCLDNSVVSNYSTTWASQPLPNEFCLLLKGIITYGVRNAPALLVCSCRKCIYKVCFELYSKLIGDSHDNQIEQRINA